VFAGWQSGGNPRPLSSSRRGIPPGVSCEATLWCDDVDCSSVCKRGTVQIPDWIQNAHRLQHKLSASLPLCFSQWFGTHNSAIALADGYGNLDPLFESMLQYVYWLEPAGSSSLIRTNDQYFSLTDQLNMGARMIELDIHWVQDRLRIAHCGGLHVEALNKLVEALNFVAKSFGYDIRWDTETVGCDPSLSSIPANFQRTLLDALEEIRDWMQDARNENEFLILYLDDEPDLREWNVVPRLLRDILAVFPGEVIFTPADRGLQDDWPSASFMVDRGFRVMFVSSTDYGKQMEQLIFPRGRAVCDWSEPGLVDIDTSGCTASGHDFMMGSLLRTPSCEIQYGPMNCDFVWKNKNSPILDETSLKEVIACGLNAPAPDLLTPERAGHAVWTWAPGYPTYVYESNCAYIASSDGLWRTSSCEELEDLPLACRANGSTPLRPEWTLALSGDGCPEFTVFGPPRHPRENTALKTLLSIEDYNGARIQADPS
jgi:hypothetical protein